MSVSKHFRIHSYFTVIDSLLSELRKRRCVYANIGQTFKAITEIRKLESSQLRETGARLLDKYSCDLEDGIVEELLHFQAHMQVLENTAQLEVEEQGQKKVFPSSTLFKCAS